MSRRSRNVILHTVVQHGWHLKKADVKAAFLQGKPFDETQVRYAMPPPELKEALGMDSKDSRPVRLLKSVYGLTRAPLDWYRKVDEVLMELGGERCITDPCVWRFWEGDSQKAKLMGLIGGHVDDFLIAGNEKNRRWREVLEVFYKAFRWSPWEQDRFKQTGLELVQDPKTGEITFSQASISSRYRRLMSQRTGPRIWTHPAPRKRSPNCEDCWEPCSGCALRADQMCVQRLDCCRQRSARQPWRH